MTRFTKRLLNLDNTTNSNTAEDSNSARNISMLYVHIPFCKELCPFCSFNRTRFIEEVAVRYFEGLEKELKMYHDRGYLFSTMYIGGGTPTVMPERLRELILFTRRLWDIEEISVETTPADITPDTLALLKSAGVNRLSVGVQSFRDSLLDSVNRRQKYGAAEQITGKLRDLKGHFDTLNVDLIFGLEGQTLDDVAVDIELAKELEIDQITCYPLMKRLEEAPGFREWLKNARWERKAYRIIRATLGTEYQASSAWCFSRSGGLIDEYIIEHPAYAGAGSGAFGYLNGNLVTNLFNLDSYIQKTGTGSQPTLFMRPFTPGEQVRYHLLMQLFHGTVDFNALTALTGRPALVRAAKLLLRFTGSIKKTGDQFTVRERTSYLTVLLMKVFFQGVSSLRGLCMENSVD